MENVKLKKVKEIRKKLDKRLDECKNNYGRGSIIYECELNDSDISGMYFMDFDDYLAFSNKNELYSLFLNEDYDESPQKNSYYYFDSNIFSEDICMEYLFKEEDLDVILEAINNNAYFIPSKLKI